MFLVAPPSLALQCWLSPDLFPSSPCSTSLLADESQALIRAWAGKKPDFSTPAVLALHLAPFSSFGALSVAVGMPRGRAPTLRSWASRAVRVLSRERAGLFGCTLWQYLLGLSSATPMPCSLFPRGPDAPWLARQAFARLRAHRQALVGLESTDRRSCGLEDVQTMFWASSSLVPAATPQLQLASLSSSLGTRCREARECLVAPWTGPQVRWTSCSTGVFFSTLSVRLWRRAYRGVCGDEFPPGLVFALPDLGVFRSPSGSDPSSGSLSFSSRIVALPLVLPLLWPVGPRLETWVPPEQDRIGIVFVGEDPGNDPEYALNSIYGWTGRHELIEAVEEWAHERGVQFTRLRGKNWHSDVASAAVMLAPPGDFPSTFREFEGASLGAVSVWGFGRLPVPQLLRRAQWTLQALGTKESMRGVSRLSKLWQLTDDWIYPARAHPFAPPGNLSRLHAGDLLPEYHSWSLPVQVGDLASSVRNALSQVLDTPSGRLNEVGARIARGARELAVATEGFSANGFEAQFARLLKASINATHRSFKRPIVFLRLVDPLCTRSRLEFLPTFAIVTPTFTGLSVIPKSSLLVNDLSEPAAHRVLGAGCVYQDSLGEWGASLDAAAIRSQQTAVHQYPVFEAQLQCVDGQAPFNASLHVEPVLPSWGDDCPKQASTAFPRGTLWHPTAWKGPPVIWFVPTLDSSPVAAATTFCRFLKQGFYGSMWTAWSPALLGSLWPLFLSSAPDRHGFLVESLKEEHLGRFGESVARLLQSSPSVFDEAFPVLCIATLTPVMGALDTALQRLGKLDALTSDW
jgi:hypothetical protein